MINYAIERILSNHSLQASLHSFDSSFKRSRSNVNEHQSETSIAGGRKPGQHPSLSNTNLELASVDGVIAVVKTIIQHHNINFTREHLNLLNEVNPIHSSSQYAHTCYSISLNGQLYLQIKRASNECLSSFIGMCFNQHNEMLLLWKFSTRGTLQVSTYTFYSRKKLRRISTLIIEDIIFNDDLNLEMNFKSSFVRDIIKVSRYSRHSLPAADGMSSYYQRIFFNWKEHYVCVQGMDYLHNGPIGIHGNLNIETCLMESHWTVKLSNFGVQNWLRDCAINNDIVFPQSWLSNAGCQSSRLS